MRVNDAIPGLVLVIFALAEIIYTRTFPSLHGQSYGPNLFPTLIGAGLIGCGLLLIARGLSARRQESGTFHWFALETFSNTGSAKVNFLLVLGALLLYILLSPTVGFIPLSLIILTLLLLRLGSSILLSVSVAVLATVVIQLLFAKVLLVPLPPGWLQGLVW